MHHEFSNEFDARDTLTKRAESNIHSVSFKPPTSRSARSGILSKAVKDEIKSQKLRESLDHNFLNKRPTIPGQQMPGCGSKTLKTTERIDFSLMEIPENSPAKPLNALSN